MVKLLISHRVTVEPGGEYAARNSLSLGRIGRIRQLALANGVRNNAVEKISEAAIIH